MNSRKHAFSTSVSDWTSRLAPVDLDKLTQEQKDALSVTPSNMKVSDYLLTLAHDPQTLKHRTPLFNAIMYAKSGLPRAERELGAMGASLINGCVYCMATHANRFIALTKQPDVVEAIFDDGEDARMEARMQLIYDFALRLSQSPIAISETDVEELRSAGFSKLEIYDLIQSVALFGWANRLMHSLGDPVVEVDALAT